MIDTMLICAALAAFICGAVVGAVAMAAWNERDDPDD